MLNFIEKQIAHNWISEADKYLDGLEVQLSNNPTKEFLNAMKTAIDQTGDAVDLISKVARMRQVPVSEQQKLIRNRSNELHEMALDARRGGRDIFYFVFEFQSQYLHLLLMPNSAEERKNIALDRFAEISKQVLKAQ